MLKHEMARSGKHVIRTETLKNRIRPHVEITTDDANEKYLMEGGLAQTVQSVLWQDGWRSVKDGYFVSLEECENLVRLKQMLRNANTRKDQAEKAYENVKSVECRQLVIAGIECDELIEEPSEEDLIAELEADAI